jgi:CPA2 family monovalent cation:H+ antiporter-2
VVHTIQMARGERYESLRGFFHGASDVSDTAEHLQVRLRSVLLTDRANALGKKLGQLSLDALGAEVTALRRNGVRIDWTPETTLLAGDILVLRGDVEELALAEGRLLKA